VQFVAVLASQAEACRHLGFPCLSAPTQTLR